MTLTQSQLKAYNDMWTKLTELTTEFSYSKNRGEWLIDEDRMTWEYHDSLYDGTKTQKLDISFYKNNCFPGSKDYKYWEIKGISSANGKINKTRLEYLKKKLDKYFNIKGEE